MTKSQRKSVAIIGTNGLPGRYGGWDQLLNNFTLKLNHKYDIAVYTSKYNPEKGPSIINGSKIILIPFKANGLQSIIYDGVSMLHAIFKYDVLLVLGTSGCVFLPIVRLFHSRIYLNPDGAEWKRGKWNLGIRLFLKFSEYLGIKLSNKIISDNKIIQQYIKNTYNKDSFLIEYGGDNAKQVDLTPMTKNKFNITNGLYAFKVCRIEPENNIDLILSAFSFCKLKLILIGNWKNSQYGINIRTRYGKFKNLLLLDPIYDQEQLDELRSNCGIYIHGHSVGGTNPSLVEAMNLGLSCVVFDVDYNRETTENCAIYYRNSADLEILVKKFEQDQTVFDGVGQKMRTIASKRYSWETVINKYDDILMS